ncbi:MAG: hypothetical protein Kow0058_00150 [Roseovarius sp.]
MSLIQEQLGLSGSPHPLRRKFLAWQCRTRQTIMRHNDGRPDAAIMPEVLLPGAEQPLGAIITVLNRTPAHSVVPELVHMAKRTFDPVQVRSRAMQYFSASYYQKPEQFSDILTATFPPGSPGARRIREAETCRLLFDAYSQQFDLWCRVWTLAPNNPLHAATMAHNRLFNPALPADAVILGFEPDWRKSSATP